MCRGSEIPERRISRGCPRNVNVPYPEKTKAKKAGRHFALIIRTVYRGVGRTRSRTGSDTGLERNTNRSDPTLYQLPTYSVNSSCIEYPRSYMLPLCSIECSEYMDCITHQHACV
jgi:hypothetical protein